VIILLVGKIVRNIFLNKMKFNLVDKFNMNELVRINIILLEKLYKKND